MPTDPHRFQRVRPRAARMLDCTDCSARQPNPIPMMRRNAVECPAISPLRPNPATSQGAVRAIAAPSRMPPPTTSASRSVKVASAMRRRRAPRNCPAMPAPACPSELRMVWPSMNTGMVAPTPAAAVSEMRLRNHESISGPEMPTANVSITGHEMASREVSCTGFIGWYRLVRNKRTLFQIRRNPSSQGSLVSRKPRPRIYLTPPAPPLGSNCAPGTWRRTALGPPAAPWPRMGRGNRRTGSPPRC